MREGPWELCLQGSPSECFSYKEEDDPLGLSTRPPLPAAGPGAEHTARGSDPQRWRLGSHSLAARPSAPVHQLCGLGQGIRALPA